MVEQEIKVIKYFFKYLKDTKSHKNLTIEDALILGFISGSNGASNFVQVLKYIESLRAIREKAKVTDNEIEEIIITLLKGEYQVTNNKIKELAKRKEKYEEPSKRKDPLDGVKRRAVNYCPICKDVVFRNIMTITSACYHACHKDCMMAAMRSKLNSGEYSFVCPFEACHTKIPLKRVLNIIPSEEIKYIIKSNLEAKGVSDFKEVLMCNKESCPYFDTLQSDDKFFCPFCNNSNYIKCNLQWSIEESKKYKAISNVAADNTAFKIHKRLSNPLLKTLTLSFKCSKCNEQVIGCLCN